jgi:formate/nitrite transporter FocA (FNT family)
MWTSNLIPVTLGNIVGALLFVGVLYWVAFRKEIAALK